MKLFGEKDQALYNRTAYGADSGIERRISESPMSVIESTEVRNILPHAVPSVMLSVRAGGRAERGVCERDETHSQQQGQERAEPPAAASRRAPSRARAERARVLPE